MDPTQPGTAAQLEVWGGVECTVNRVQDRLHDQLRASGHDRRIDDLDLIASLGIRRLRYPVLWETIAPQTPARFQWSWADERLDRMRALNIEPIVGLLHHGSGPRYTDLLDAHFPELLANYAAAVAARFPWVGKYTPVNEPLTTARFSALYGHWYPHHRDDRSFARALLNQCRATVLAMQAIRRVNPRAQLIQTEDLGTIRSTATLAYQASMENARRWLTWDLLCGRVDKHHRLRTYLIDSGVDRRELDWMRALSCPPDMIGINHYVTSDRYISEAMQRFPLSSHGGNGRHEYADVEVVRALSDRSFGLRELLNETWARYRIPLAVTEAHIACTREEQMRWLHEVWLAATNARNDGADVRAVTVWALLGSFDWNSLLTRFTGHYEPGAFDVRSAVPRRTALARFVQDLLRGTEPERTSLSRQPGWWRRSERLYPLPTAKDVAPPAVSDAGPELSSAAQPILVTGASGTLGRAFARICGMRGLLVRASSRAELDICEPDCIARLLAQTRPWAVINTAGYVRVDDAERDRERCYRENSRGAELLARACAERGIPFVTFSSDLVFDGERTSPYVEGSAVRPLNVYGISKARAERGVALAHPGALIVRTSSFFAPWDEHNFVTIALRTLSRGQPFAAIDDVVVSPTYVPDLVHATLDLLIDGESGLWHLVNDGKVSWAELAKRSAQLAGVDTARLSMCNWRTLGLAAKRPSFSALTSERGLPMPSLEDALARYVVELRHPLQEAVA